MILRVMRPKSPVMKGLLGICFFSELDTRKFPYGIAVKEKAKR